MSESNSDHGQLLPKRRSAFQWNAGGWFGGQLGGTAWILASAIILGTRSLALASIWFVCFLVPNLLGFYLYSRRDRLAAYPCLQTLLGVIGICSFVAWTSLVILRRDLIGLLGISSPWVGYLSLLIIPGIMLQFHFQQSHPTRVTKASELER